MKILVLQGPNLNLIGLKSARIGERVTLDKINKALRRHVRNRDIELKILQTHKIEKALTFLQRNRNWADGLLLAPSAWGRYEYALKETLALIRLPAVELYFDGKFSLGTTPDDSILSPVCLKTIAGHPLEVFSDGLEELLRHCRQRGEVDPEQ
jgi:3-dehydroquinate dehydratase-2